MGCECATFDEQGEIRNSSIEKSGQKTKEPEFNSGKTPAGNGFTPFQPVDPNAKGTPLLFCSRNTSHGEIIDVSRVSQDTAAKKTIKRLQSASMYQGWHSTQIGDKLFQVREGNA